MSCEERPVTDFATSFALDSAKRVSILIGAWIPFLDFCINLDIHMSPKYFSGLLEASFAISFSVSRAAECRDRHAFSSELQIAKIGIDAAKNEPFFKVSRK